MEKFIRISSPNITELLPGEIFVFGSNKMGKHGKGAAKIAHKKFGAIWGQGSGLQGQSYGLCTKGTDLRFALPIDEIKKEVEEFTNFVTKNTHLIFQVTEIGCGLAGYLPKEMAPLFKDASKLDNVFLPYSFWEIIETL